MKSLNVMKKLLNLILLLTVVNTYSQNTVNINNYSSLNGERGLGNNPRAGIWINNSVDNDVIGDTYLLKNWSNTMTIFTYDKKSYSIINSNLDLLKDRFVTKVSKDSIFEFDNRNIKYVKLNNIVYKRFDYESNKHFLAVIFNGNKASFLKKNNVYIKEGSFNPMTQKKVSKDKYAIKNKYFVFMNGEIKEIHLKKSDVLKVFKDKKNMIKNFIKENKLSYKSELDIIKLFEFYNLL